MKKNILFILSFIICGGLSAQVGVNTGNPQGTFHIDADKNNPTSGSTFTFAEQNKDVIVMPDGKMGIGTIHPDTKLDIRSVDATLTNPTYNTGFRLVDGNEKTGRVLQTDANGLATWKDISKRDIVIGRFSAPPQVFSDNDPAVVATVPYKFIGANITLKPGKYAVYLGLSVYLPVSYPLGYSYYLPVFLSSSNTSVNTAGFNYESGAGNAAAFGGRMVKNRGNTSLNMIQGSIIVNVTNPAGITLYTFLKNIPLYNDVTLTSTQPTPPLTSYRLNATNWENFFYALPIN